MTQRSAVTAMSLAFSMMLGLGSPGFGEDDAKAPASQVDAALLGPVQVDFHGMTLWEAVEQVAEVHQIRVLVDNAALADAGVADDLLLRSSPKVVLQDGSLEALSLASALDRVLGPHKLSWFVDDGVLQVTSLEQAEARMQLKVYDVAYILRSKDASREPHVDEDRLADSIVHLVRPESWLESGGAGVVEVVNGLLIVRQNYSAHREIDAILTQLRLVRDEPLNVDEAAGTVAAAGQ